MLIHVCTPLMTSMQAKKNQMDDLRLLLLCELNHNAGSIGCSDAPASYSPSWRKLALELTSEWSSTKGYRSAALKELETSYSVGRSTLYAFSPILLKILKGPSARGLSFP